MSIFKKKETKKEAAKPAAKAAKKPAAKKAQTKKPTSKPVKKEEVKKPAAKVAKPAKKEEAKKVYHVSKRASDGKWVIKFAGGEKAIKIFDTKQEAVTYVNFLVKSNKQAVVLTHASKGKKQGKINAKIK